LSYCPINNAFFRQSPNDKKRWNQKQENAEAVEWDDSDSDDINHPVIRK